MCKWWINIFYHISRLSEKYPVMLSTNTKKSVSKKLNLKENIKLGL